jgi:hypothetical protein
MKCRLALGNNSSTKSLNVMFQMLQIIGLACPASVRRFKDQQVHARFQNFHQESNSPLESYEELAFPVIQKLSTKVAVSSHPQLKMPSIHLDICNSPARDPKNSECAQHHAHGRHNTRDSSQQARASFGPPTHGVQSLQTIVILGHTQHGYESVLSITP